MFKETSMSKEFPYLYRGVVLVNNDPLHLGRCKVRVPAIYGDITDPTVLPWSRVLTTHPVNSIRGSYDIPDVGSVVWILFEGGNLDYPVYLGGTFSTSDIPIVYDKVQLYQDAFGEFSYDRSTDTFSLTVGENSLTMRKDGSIDIKSANSIKLEAPRVTIIETGDEIPE